MALIQIKKDPTQRELRQFGCLLLPLFCLVLGFVAWARWTTPTLAIWVFSVGGMSALAGAIRPSLLRPVFLGLMYAAAPIGWVVSHLVVAFIYYALVAPIGLLLRLVGRNPIPRGFDEDAATYWNPAPKDRPLESYFRQY